MGGKEPTHTQVNVGVTLEWAEGSDLELGISKIPSKQGAIRSYPQVSMTHILGESFLGRLKREKSDWGEKGHLE